jgi:hypothetical protein
MENDQKQDDFRPRQYQEKLMNLAKKQNTIIYLPTGSGKTFIAVMLIFFIIIYENLVCTSQETHHVSATKTSRLMLFRGTFAVFCDNHAEHTDTLCGQNAEF